MLFPVLFLDSDDLLRLMECHDIESPVFAKERRDQKKTELPRFDLRKYRIEEATAVVIVKIDEDKSVQSI